MKRIIRDYFTFSKKERIAVVLLLILMAIFIIAPYLYRVKPATPVVSGALSAFIAGADTQSVAQESGETFTPTTAARKITLFPFDPNTVSEQDWARLGLPARTIRTILNYRSKGGQFRSPEDIRKIWGLRQDDADRLVPYVQIAIKAPPVKPVSNEKDAFIRQPNKKAAAPLDINKATAEDWKSLPGIGEVLASRIVKFRDVVGGFRSIEQVKKTYGISDSVFMLIRPYLLLDPSGLPKTNLNTASVYELRSRVDLPYAVARAIVNYREQNGPFRSVTELQKILSMPDSVWQKLILSLKVE